MSQEIDKTTKNLSSNEPENKSESEANKMLKSIDTKLIEPIIAATQSSITENVDIETAKEESNVKVNATFDTTDNSSKQVTATIANGEKLPTAVAAASAAVATITPAQQMPPKSHEPTMAPAQMSLAAGSNGENATNKAKMDNSDATQFNFKLIYVITQLCGLTMIVLMGSWIGVHLGGLSGTSNPATEFNWHPLFMTIGLIFLYGNSILVYRGFRSTRKKTLKIAHASIHMGAFILTVIALKTVFDSHNLRAEPIPNMYSIHSWLGLSAVLIFCLQYVCGFMAYLVPGMKERYKIAYMPLHVYFGLFGFVLAIASALMGITEKAIFSVPSYSDLPSSGVMANLCGLLFVIFGGLVVYLTTEPSYKRKPLPEDAVLLTGINE